ncbi:hypothetical protein [Streptomyces sp. NRRL B-1347]|uniref:hypothetical protein n=1 Tax=Streptomyces sp. NRRL B-1347 TaxID=1476877 RepID=UPI0004C94235|nr:hypothetical protein [Streptomyces sp. NRRL B-1347]
MTVTHVATLQAPAGSDPKPVEQAVVNSIADGFPPETYLGIAFYPPGGGCRTWHAWTDGGHILGDRVDSRAITARLDAADWLHIGDRHSSITCRGRTRIEAYPLRPVLTDVDRREHCPMERRVSLRRVIDCAAAQTGQIAHPGLPRWIGFGPALLLRKAPPCN